jgi:hypothetical protein
MHKRLQSTVEPIYSLNSPLISHTIIMYCFFPNECICFPPSCSISTHIASFYSFLLLATNSSLAMILTSYTFCGVDLTACETHAKCSVIAKLK